MSKWLDSLILIVLALALSFFVLDKFVVTPQQQAEEIAAAREEARIETLFSTYGAQSIAVLPFADMSPAGNLEYFSDGLSEELLNSLSKIPALRVISRSSAFSYKGRSVPIPTIASQLNVDHILEGSIRQEGDEIRITAQLIEARSDTHVWSGTYDRTLRNIFEIQNEIAEAVVMQLKIELLDEVATRKPIDPQAYSLYLQAKYKSRQGTAVAMNQSNMLYLQSLAIEPDYADAWGGLAFNYFNQASDEKGYSLARETAKHALTIDPTYAFAHVVLGRIAVFDDSHHDLKAAARHHELALVLKPTDADIIGHTASLLFLLGRFDQAIPLFNYWIAHDPLYATGHYYQAINYLLAGRLDEAIASAQTALGLELGYGGAHYVIGEALMFKGDLELALDTFLEERIEQLRVKGAAMVLYSLGRQAEFKVTLDELKAGWGTKSPSEVAHVFAWQGDIEAAFEWLAKAEAQSEPGLAGQFLQPFFAPLHTDPRWLAFRERMGTSQEQLDAIELKVVLP
ncbi:MAG: hypothetical protein HKN59_00385 [Gammaproteobacteria bacterium]|nr:hypothetical protein [Gammaproteobacteria bacterium]